MPIVKKGKWYTSAGFIGSVATIGAFVAGGFGIDPEVFGSALTEFGDAIVAAIGAGTVLIASIVAAFKSRKAGKK